ncbi:hypothetical protein E2C01_065229 [Portunus trituberculatus]|uniref:Reverse transcriptase domain-containing protein n=1 Tax=Portunus trituberculatus TaxID=210409 RepID=A0A5B7HLC8_PORTR|nr:hypothetical protein [Portunus trituberculatus]
MVVLCYLDDCFFIASSVESLQAQVSYALYFFDSLGLTVNVWKLVLEPTKKVMLLGVVLDSVAMTTTLTSRRKERIKEQGLLLLKGNVILRDLSSFIGLTVASAPAVELGPLRYRYLELIRDQGLARSCGDFDKFITLDCHAQHLVAWWVANIDFQEKSLLSSSPYCELFTDACLTGWGASMGHITTGGHWAQEELDHINIL